MLKNETVKPEDSEESDRSEITVRKELIIKKILVIVTRKHLNCLKSKVHETHNPMNNVKSNCDNSVNIGVESNRCQPKYQKLQE